jgi:hypothetical protein
MSAVDPTNGRRSLAAIRRRLEKLELEHLRAHAAELADKVDRLQADLHYAESAAISWRDDCLRMMEESLPDGGAIALALDGSLHVVKKPDTDATPSDLVTVLREVESFLEGLIGDETQDGVPEKLVADLRAVCSKIVQTSAPSSKEVG